MKSTLPATHLLRHFLLFVLTVLFLMTLVRAAYALWQYPRLEETQAFLPLFLQGLRFDLALVGLICLVPVVLGSLLAIFSATRSASKLLISAFLVVGLALILLMELITPWFIQTQGLRPDISMLREVEHPLQTTIRVAGEQAIPLAVASILCVLIMIAFWSRLELQRFLRYRLSAPSGLALAIGGGLLCMLAIWSGVDMRKPALSPGDSLISVDPTVNDLSMNSTYKMLYSLALPVLSQPR